MAPPSEFWWLMALSAILFLFFVGFAVLEWVRDIRRHKH